MTSKLTLGLILGALTLPVLAQTSTPRIDQRQANQEARIQRGVNNGSLTAGEANRLERGQAHVAKMENRAVADGKVTGQERRRIEHAQDVQSRHIARDTHNRRRQ